MKAILYKDFLVAGRRWQTYLWRTIAVALLGGLVILIYSIALKWFDPLGPGTLALMGSALVLYFFVIAFILTILGVPTAVIRGFLDERERQTMGLLVASPLRPWTIAAGKTLAALSRTGIALLGVTPVLFVAYSMGGTEAGGVVSALAYVAAGGILAGAVALGALMTRFRGGVIMVITHGIVLGHTFLSLVLMESFGTASTTRDALGTLLHFNPLYGCVMALQGDTFPPPPGYLPPLGPGSTLGIASLLLLLATLGLGKRLGRAGETGGGRGKRKPSRRKPMGSRPVYWYERQVRLRSRDARRQAIRVVGLVLIFLFIWALSVDMDARWPFVWSFYMTAQFVLFVTFLSAVVEGAWTGGDPRSEAPLLTAPISMLSVAGDKVLALMIRSLIGLGVVAAFFGVTFATHPRFTREHDGPFGWVPIHLVVMASITLGVIGLGSLGALLARATGSAARGTAATLSLFFGSAAGIPMILELLDVDWDQGMVLVAATNPGIMAIWLPDNPADEVLGPGVTALGLEALIVGGILWATLRAWEPLSRRKA